MQVPGNSVPGERAWSIQNLIQNKSRSQLKEINVDRLLYIYMNERILQRPTGPKEKKLPYTHGLQVTDEQLIQLEDNLMNSEFNGEDVIYSDSDSYLDGDQDADGDSDPDPLDERII